MADRRINLGPERGLQEVTGPGIPGGKVLLVDPVSGVQFLRRADGRIGPDDPYFWRGVKKVFGLGKNESGLRER